MSTCTKCGNTFIGSEELSKTKPSVAICDDCFKEGMEPTQQEPPPPVVNITLPPIKPRQAAVYPPVNSQQEVKNHTPPLTSETIIEYDPKLVHEYASRLYHRSMIAVRVCTMIAVFVGGIIGGVLGYATFKFTDVKIIGAVLGFIIGAILLGLLGYDFGLERSFAIKMRAQLALCQVAMEENTRPKDKKAPDEKS